MITKQLPKYIHPLRLTEQGAILSGKLPLTNFSRLADMLTQEKGEVEIYLQFGQDDERIPYIKGTLKTCLRLACQRCLKTVDYPLEISISLSPVFDEIASKKLPDRYEPLLLEEDQALLLDIIEEELLLNLAIVPKHEDIKCAD